MPKNGCRKNSDAFLGGKMIVKKIPLIIGLVFIASCGVSTGSLETQPQLSPTISITKNVSLSQTLGPTQTTLPTSKAIPALIPTLPMEEARKKFLDLLANNGNCNLPCLWGITPGKSSFQEARIILEPLSGLSSRTYLNTLGSGSISPSYDNGVDLSIYTSLHFLANTNDNIINRISFRAEAHSKIAYGGYENVYNSAFFGDRVKFYELPNLLSVQGMPAAVLVSTLAKPPTRGGEDGFYLLLLYPDRGMLVYYTAEWKKVDKNVFGCFANAHVELELFPSGHGDSFSEFLSQTKWANMWPIPDNSPTWKSIEKATPMTLEKFYETFHNPTDKCIETPANLWPTPEP